MTLGERQLVSTSQYKCRKAGESALHQESAENSAKVSTPPAIEGTLPSFEPEKPLRTTAIQLQKIGGIEVKMKRIPKIVSGGQTGADRATAGLGIGS
jgi:hypothetical protein